MNQLQKWNYVAQKLKHILLCLLLFIPNLLSTSTQENQEQASSQNQDPKTKTTHKSDLVDDQKEAAENITIWIPYRYSNLEKIIAIFTATLLVWGGYFVLALHTWGTYLKEESYYSYIWIVLAAMINFGILVQAIKVIAFRADILATEKELIIPIRLEKQYTNNAWFAYLENKKIVVSYKNIVLVRRKEAVTWSITGRTRYSLVELICQKGDNVQIYELHGIYCQNLALLEDLLYRFLNKKIIVDMNG